MFGASGAHWSCHGVIGDEAHGYEALEAKHFRRHDARLDAVRQEKVSRVKSSYV